MIHPQIAGLYFTLSKKRIIRKIMEIRDMSESLFESQKFAISRADFVETLRFVLTTFKK